MQLCSYCTTSSHDPHAGEEDLVATISDPQLESAAEQLKVQDDPEVPGEICRSIQLESVVSEGPEVHEEDLVQCTDQSTAGLSVVYTSGPMSMPGFRKSL